MNKKKWQRLSLCLDKETQEKIQNYAKTKGVSVSKLVRELADKYMIGGNEEIIPVILSVPAKLKGDKENLEKWLEQKSFAIVAALS